MSEIEEQIQEIQALLIARFGITPDEALEAVHEAYLNLQGKDIKNMTGYWFIAAKNHVISSFKKEDKEFPLEDYHLDADYQDEVKITEDEDTIGILLEYLEGRERKLFKLLLTGQPVADIAKQMGVARLTIYRWREDLFEECREYLATRPPIPAPEPPLKDVDDVQILPKDVYRQHHEYDSPEEFKYLVPAYFDALRNKKGIKAEELSTAMGLSSSAFTVTKHYGLSTFSKFIEYSEALGVDPEEAFKQCWRLFKIFRSRS